MSWRPFQELFLEYDRWFDEHPDIFRVELEALSRLFPSDGMALEVGVGTGRFAGALGIRFGADPALSALGLAASRGVKVVCAVGEELPFPACTFDAVLVNTVLCFAEDPEGLLGEARRVLKPAGSLILGIIDAASPLGRLYEAKKDKSPFFRHARLLSAQDVLELLKSYFKVSRILQCLFGTPDDAEFLAPPRPGYGRGGFVVFLAHPA